METLSDYILDAQDAAGVDVLTPAQKEQAFKDYEKYSVDYDGVKKRLIDIENISQESTGSLSLESFQEYFSRFS